MDSDSEQTSTSDDIAHEEVIGRPHENRNYRNAKRVIGALAYDIRCDWGSNVRSRISEIYSIANEYGIGVPSMTETRAEDTCNDGRYMRSWGGPYGTCYMGDLVAIGRSIEIFNCPDYVIDDGDNSDNSGNSGNSDSD